MPRRRPSASPPFHVIQWATRTVDAVRRELWRRLRRSGRRAEAHALQRARWVLWKAPERLAEAEHERLAGLARTNRPLYRAYFLKETLRAVFPSPTPEAGLARLDRWLACASRSRLQPFVALAQTVSRHRARIEATLRHRLTNARIEPCNSKLRLLHRVAFGSRNVQAFPSLVPSSSAASARRFRGARPYLAKTARHLYPGIKGPPARLWAREVFG